MSEIIICYACEGTGQLHYQIPVSGHNTEYKTWDEVCALCEGTGRLVRTDNTTPFRKLKFKKKTKEVYDGDRTSKNSTNP